MAEDSIPDFTRPRRLPVSLVLGLFGVVLLLGTVGLIGAALLFEPRRPRPGPAAAALPPDDFQVPPGLAWAAEPDPAPAPAGAPATAPEHLGTGRPVDKVYYPATPSPFAATMHAPGWDCTVWDLHARKPAGSFPLPGPAAAPAVSPDGRHYALVAWVNGNRVVEVRTTDAGKLGHQFPCAPGAGATPDLFGFAGDNRLVLAERGPAARPGGSRTVRAWDLAKPALALELQGDFDGAALSAGGRYLTTHANSRGKATLLLTDLKTGRPVGRIGLQDGECLAAAFSPDGKELVTWESADRREFKDRLVFRDVRTGQELARHSLPEPHQFVAHGATRSPGSLQWRADSGAVLVAGRSLVDRKTGAVAWSLPPAQGPEWWPRLVGDALVRPGRDGLRFTPLPRGPAWAARRTADFAAARTVHPPPGVVAWAARPDPGQALPGAAPDVPLLGPGRQVRAVLFSPAGVAAVLFASDTQIGQNFRRLRLERYDLAGRQALGGADLYQTTAPLGGAFPLVASLSPDGATVALVNPNDPRTVELFGPDGKAQLAWAPGRGGQKVRQATLLPGSQALTVDGDGVVALWELPACKALYLLEGAAGPVALSPGRKYFAASRADAVELYDVETGGLRGRLPAGGAVTALTFAPDGRRLAGVKAGAGRETTLLAWDVLDGRAVASFPVEPAFWGLQWCGDGHVLRDHAELLDLAWQGPVWRYKWAEAWYHATDSPDGRHWFVTVPGLRPGNGGASLRAQTLPDAGAAALSARLPAGAPVRLRAGETVAIRLDLGAVPEAGQEVADRLRFVLGDRLRAAGYKVGPGGRCTAVARGQGDELTVELTDDRGVVLWSTVLPPARARKALAGMRNGRWRIIPDHVLDLDLPSQLVETPQGILALPGRSSVSGDPAGPGR